jgi:hypothetical protein
MRARLAVAEAIVTELAAPFGVSLPAVSTRLRVLKPVGLLGTGSPRTLTTVLAGRS